MDEHGLALRRDALRYGFDKARWLASITKDDLRFRDLRTKAGPYKADDSGDVRQAQPSWARIGGHDRTECSEAERSQGRADPPNCSAQPTARSARTRWDG